MADKIISVSGQYIGKRALDCFHIAHKHPLRGCICAFLGVILQIYQIQYGGLLDILFQFRSLSRNP